MKRCIRVLTLVFLVAAIAGCQATPYHDPFVISRSEIYERVDTLAMMPLQWILPELDRKEEVSARYETLITERIEAAGFTVIPSEESSSIRNSVIEKMGGVFDPVSGEVDEEKQQVLNDQFAQEMNAKFDIDGYIVPRIVRVAASWSDNSAKWGGVTESVSGTTGFLVQILTGMKHSGTIPAISLFVVLTGNTNSEAYYVGIGGIQLAAHYGETFASGFEDIPKSEWFVDEEKDVTAVTIALSGLVNEPGDGKPRVLASSATPSQRRHEGP